MKRLRVPVAVAFVLIGCSDDGGTECSPGNPRSEPCVQAPNDPVPCPENQCVDANGMCPAGCIRASSKLYCVPDSTDAGCPPNLCIAAGQSCPPRRLLRVGWAPA